MQRLVLALVAILIGVACAYAQTADYHVGFGLRFDSSPPPETMDMAGVGKVYGPASGKQLKIFILAGDGWRGRQGDSRLLPVDVRRGTPDLLMYDDGRWQPLRPTQLSFGPVVSFALSLSEHFPGETVGIVSLPGGDVVAEASRAMHAVPSDVVCMAVAGRPDEMTARPDIVRTRLGLPELRVVNISAHGLQDASGDDTRMTLEMGKAYAASLLEQLKIQSKE